MSAFPLYTGHGFDGDDVRQSTQWALQFSRGFGGYPHDFGRPADSDKTAFLTRFHQKKCGDANLLRRHAQRTRDLVRHMGGVCFEMVAEERLLTGLGNSHPLENGMSWHPTLGVPFLSGAAVKGLTRAFLNEWNAASPLYSRDEELFGISPKRGLSRDVEVEDFSAGAVVFFDLVPLQPVTLVVDVMTPHYANWYLSGGKDPGKRDTIPADWHDPTPVGVLGVEFGAMFQLALALRPGATAKDRDTLHQVADVAADAFALLGIGAKTAVGYGRMRREIPPPEVSPGAARVQALLVLQKNDRSVNRGGPFVREVGIALKQLDLFTPQECAQMVVLFEDTFKRYEWKRGKDADKYALLDAFRHKAAQG